jgi:hypothetical protein
MASGWTTTGSLADSLPTVRDSARIVREYEGVMIRLVEKHSKPEGMGLSWSEVDLAQLAAGNVTELTDNENFQQLSDTLITITPTFTQIAILMTKRVRARISKNVAAKMGVLGQNAMNRKKDQDLIAIGQAATTDLGTAGSPMTFSQVGAAAARIQGNATEPAVSRISTVLHRFHIKDIQDEIEAGVGTYAVPNGLSEEVFRRGFQGSVSGSEVFHDGNIAVDSSTDAEGFTFAKEALIHVDGLGPTTDEEYFPRKGAGAHVVTLTDEYGQGERSAGNWLYSHTADATSP